MSEACEPRSHLVYGWAWLVACLTFPLIWLGGLVTTHDAGMAVPDWPGTFGYNLFLYPISTWVFGPFDLFVEHGHRLLASLVGLLAIFLCWFAYKYEQRRWARVVCYAFLAAIISQGLLGGARVLLDARTAAMIHGCTGPLVFTLGCFVVMVCSKDWYQSRPVPISKGLRRAAVALFLFSMVQLFLGAQLRHSQPTWIPSFFMSIVHTHLTMAMIILGLILWVFTIVRCNPNRQVVELRAPSSMLVAIVIAQVALGFATWVANYATPWMELTPWLARYTVQGKGFWESMIVTGHQATGSLLIVCSLWLTCRISIRGRVVEDKLVERKAIEEGEQIVSATQPSLMVVGENG